MALPLPPCPYRALGVHKDASDALIKKTYRKLVLTCHPDKVLDPNLRAAKADEFHKIQQAYDIIGNDEERSRYDASVRLAELRKEKIEREKESYRSAAYDAPPVSSPRPPAYESRGSARHAHEDRSRAASYEDDPRYFEEPSRNSSRKYDKYEAEMRHKPAWKSSTRPDDGHERMRFERSSRDKERSDRKKTKDRDIRREREASYSYVEDLDDEELPGSRHNSDDERRRDKHGGSRRRSDEPTLPSRPKYVEQIVTQQQYVEQSKRERTFSAQSRPEFVRSTSSQDAYIRRGDSSGRPTIVRRETSRPSTSDDRPRKNSAAEDFDPQEKSAPAERRAARPPRPPPLQTHNSSPGGLMRDSYDMHPPTNNRRRRGGDDVSPPTMSRAETLPAREFAETRRRSSNTTAPAKGSRLRHSETFVQHDSGYSSSESPPHSYPTTPTPTSANKRTQYIFTLESGDRDPLDFENISPRSPRDAGRDRERERERDRDRDHDRRDRHDRSPEAHHRRMHSDRPPLQTLRSESYTKQGTSRSASYAYNLSSERDRGPSRPALTRTMSSRGDRPNAAKQAPDSLRPELHRSGSTRNPDRGGRDHHRSSRESPRVMRTGAYDGLYGAMPIRSDSYDKRAQEVTYGRDSDYRRGMRRGSDDYVEAGWSAGDGYRPDGYSRSRPGLTKRAETFAGI